MNLNKYSKAELISKFKKLESKNENNINSIINQTKSYFDQIINLILTLKSILIKLTFITLFIKIIKKYSIFRRLWSILNTIVMSIFGLSLLDNFGFDFIINFFTEIKLVFTNTIDYLSNTNFYNYLSKLFSKKEEIIYNETNKINKEVFNEKLKKIPEGNKSSGIWTPTDTPEHKVSEWLKSKEKENPISEEINESNNKIKYLVIGTTIILVSCLGWVYWQEIKTGGNSFLEWLFSSRSTGTNNPRSDSDSNATPIASNIPTRINSPDIELIEQSKKLSSPSLEDLNEKVQDSWDKSTSPSSSTSSIETSSSGSSTSSNSSQETVTPSKFVNISTMSFVDKIKYLNSTNNLIENVVDKNWKILLMSDMKSSIEYVENNFPKNELDNSSYVENLINEIKTKNVHFTQETLSLKSKMTINELRAAHALAHKTELWIEEMQNKIENLGIEE